VTVAIISDSKEVIDSGGLVFKEGMFDVDGVF